MTESNTTLSTICIVLSHGRTKCQSGRSPTIGWGRRGGKAGEGSIVESQVKAAPPEWKHPTSTNRKKKVDQNNPQPKRKWAKQTNESDVQPGETGMEHEGATSFIGDRDGLASRAKSREGTELSYTPTDGVGSEDNVVDFEGVDSSSTPLHTENEMTTSFPNGLTTLDPLLSFCNHVLLDIWRNKARGFLKCINHGSQVSIWQTIQAYLKKERLGSFDYFGNESNSLLSGQAEKEFRVEVEAIGRVRHKNLVRLLGCLLYEYIDNGNLEQWLHGDVGLVSPLTWEIRMNIILGTAKGLAYLHEGLEPKVVHRDVKSSNILLDRQGGMLRFMACRCFTNVTAENAIAMVDAVIAFLSRVEEE
ncbi:hypothetical protein Syun_023501 [Stephania yunnanensis]|uniref:Protein kinase domain-containing protein n=1 Tax=Stephania yunnanensis TaxID=152371 RepID=A0AAP0I3H6_9MAGN